jgi:hypothetical protein
LRRRIVLFGFDKMKDAVGIVLDDLFLPLLALEVIEDLDVGIGRIDFHDATSMGLFLRKSNQNWNKAKQIELKLAAFAVDDDDTITFTFNFFIAFFKKSCAKLVIVIMPTNIHKLIAWLVFNVAE